MFKVIFGAVVGLLFFSNAAFALCSSYPNNLVNGTPTDATKVMANFNCAALTSGPTIASPTFTGAVGIGTSSPGNTLGINGNISMGSVQNSWAGPSQFGALDFPRGEILFSNTNTQNQLYLASNAYNNSTGVFAYRNTGTALALSLDTGSFGVLVAPSGTAGSTIPWTNALTVSNAGTVSITSLTVSGTFVATGLVTNSDLANSSLTIAGSAVSLGSSLSATTLTASLNVFTSSSQGVVPSSGGGTANFLRADGSWATPSGAGNASFGTVSGNVTGNIVCMANTTTGIKDCGVAPNSTAPTIQKFTSGSGTYTTPTGVKWIEIVMVGGGGGGGSSGTTFTGSATSGGATTFGSSLLTASGGGGGEINSPGGTGGTVTVNSPAVDMGSFPGSYGFTAGSSPVVTNGVGASGGSSPLGGGGYGGTGGGPTNPANGVANTGSGGGGAAYASSGFFGSGGGSGGYIHALISSPSTSYSYSIGAGGSGEPAGGGGGGAGANGAAGIIIVTEHY